MTIAFRSVFSYLSNYLRRHSPTLFRLSIVRQFVPWLTRIGPPAFRRKLVELVPHEAVQKVKNSSDVMYTTAKGILESKREKIPEWGLETEEDEASSRQDIITELRKLTCLIFDIPLFRRIADRW